MFYLHRHTVFLMWTLPEITNDLFMCLKIFRHAEFINFVDTYFKSYTESKQFVFNFNLSCPFARKSWLCFFKKIIFGVFILRMKALITTLCPEGLNSICIPKATA